MYMYTDIYRYRYRHRCATYRYNIAQIYHKKYHIHPLHLFSLAKTGSRLRLARRQTCTGAPKSWGCWLILAYFWRLTM